MKDDILVALREGVAYVLGTILFLLIVAAAVFPIFIMVATKNSNWLWMLIISIPFVSGVCRCFFDL
ncbi:MAG: hypothetical protein IKU32_02140 [Clostridia bacterium]|nr:hypothetical protein [Clostridia bacterium]